MAMISQYKVGQVVEVLVSVYSEEKDRMVSVWAAAEVAGRFNERQTREHDAGWLLRVLNPDGTATTQEVSEQWEEIVMRPSQAGGDDDNAQG